MKSFIQFLKRRTLNETIDISTITIPEFDEYVQNLINKTGFNYHQLMSYLLDEEGLSQSSNEDDSAYEKKRIALLNHIKNHYSYLNKIRSTNVRDTIHSLLPTRNVPTERIQELTQEQLDVIPHFVRSWVNAIVNHRTNEEDVINGLKHLGFNNVTFVDSLEGIDRVVGNTRWNQVGNQVEEQVYDLVYRQVRYQVRDQVLRQVRDQVRDRVGDRVWSQVRDQVYDRVGRQVYDQVWDRVWNQANFAMFSYYENVLNIEINEPDYEHVKDILLNTRLIFSTNNQNEIFVLRK